MLHSARRTRVFTLAVSLSLSPSHSLFHAFVFFPKLRSNVNAAPLAAPVMDSPASGWLAGWLPPSPPSPPVSVKCSQHGDGLRRLRDVGWGWGLTSGWERVSAAARAALCFPSIRSAVLAACRPAAATRPPGPDHTCLPLELTRPAADTGWPLNAELGVPRSIQKKKRIPKDKIPYAPTPYIHIPELLQKFRGEKCK